MALDPSARALIVSTDDGALHLTELMNPGRPLLGANAADSSAVVELTSASAFGQAPPDVGAAACLSFNYDGTTLLTGHPSGKVLRWELGENSAPTVLADVNASVTNLVFVSPLRRGGKGLKVSTVVKPAQAERNYTLTAQFAGELGTAEDDMFGKMVSETGFTPDVLQRAILEFQQPVGGGGAGDEDLKRQNDELLEMVGDQKALLKELLAKVPGGKAGGP